MRTNAASSPRAAHSCASAEAKPDADWKPINTDARLIVRPAKAEDQLVERIKRYRANPSREMLAVLGGKSPLFRTGDQAGGVTIEGITGKGLVLGQCECGKWDIFGVNQIFRAIGKNKPGKRLGCQQCMADRSSARKEAKSGIKQIIVEGNT